MKKTKPVLFFAFLVLLGLANATRAEDSAPPPPWLQPHVLQAYISIGLTDEQKPAFNAAMAEYVQKSGRGINKVISTNKGNLDRAIKREIKKHSNRWNNTAQEILTEEQYPKYEMYRDILIGTILRR